MPHPRSPSAWSQRRFPCLVSGSPPVLLVSNAFAHSLCSLAPLPRSLLGSTCAPGYASSLAPLADGIFTISQVLSPLLPIALVAGQFAASGRLTRKGLFTLNPKRIAIAGKIRIYAFDKTGTITKDGLDFIGAEMPDPATGHLVSPDVSRGMAPPTLSRGLASCHAVAGRPATYEVASCTIRGCDGSSTSRCSRPAASSASEARTRAVFSAP